MEAIAFGNRKSFQSAEEHVAALYVSVDIPRYFIKG